MFAENLDASAMSRCLLTGVKRWLKYGYARNIFHDNFKWDIGRHGDRPLSDEIFTCWQGLGFADQTRFSVALALALKALGQDDALDTSCALELIAVVSKCNDIRAAGEIAALSTTKAFSALDEGTKQDFLAVALVALSEMLPVNREYRSDEVSSIEDAVLTVATGGNAFDKEAAHYSLATLIRIAPDRIIEHLLTLQPAITLAEMGGFPMPVTLLKEIRQAMTVPIYEKLRVQAQKHEGDEAVWLQVWVKILCKESPITRILDRHCQNDSCTPEDLRSRTSDVAHPSTRLHTRSANTQRKGLLRRPDRGQSRTHQPIVPAIGL